MTTKWNEGQLRVINWRNCSILVSAAAGSGKTAALVERIIRMVVEDGVEINTLVVVTFTRAAAAQMKEKLTAAFFRRLQEAGEGEDSRENRELRARLERQISLVNTAQITTIDSFCQYIIRNYFYAVDNLDPQFRVMDDEEGDILLSETLDELLEEKCGEFIKENEGRDGEEAEKGTQGETGTRGKAENEGEAENEEKAETRVEAEKGGDPGNEDVSGDAFRDLFELLSGWKNDLGFKSIIRELYSKSQTHPMSLRWLDSLLKPYERAGEGEEYAWMRSILNVFGVRLKELISLNDMARDCVYSEETEKWFQIITRDRSNLEELRSCLDSGKPYENVRLILQDIYGEAPGRAFERWSANRKRLPEVEQAKRLRDVYLKILKELYESYFNMNELCALTGLPLSDGMGAAGKCMGSQRDMVRELLGIVRELIESYDEVKRAGSLVDFNDMEHIALNILTRETEGGLAASRTALSLRAGLSQIMIDEYQDSNEVQETILTAIAGAGAFDRSKDAEGAKGMEDAEDAEGAKGMEGAKGTEGAEGVSGAGEGRIPVFMVGDVKQSIYGFRYARPALFMEKYETFSPWQDYAKEADDSRKGKQIRVVLDRNYRSRNKILSAVNRIFKGQMYRDFSGVEYDEEASLKYGGLYGEDGKDSESFDAELILTDRNTHQELLGSDDPMLEERHEQLSNAQLQAIATGRRILELKEQRFKVREGDTEREVCYSDIVVLLRSLGDTARAFKAVLEQMGIPTVFEAKTGYFEALEVQLVLNFLKVISNPVQDIPLASLLRSNLGGFNEEDLSELSVLSPRERLYDRLREAAGSGTEGAKEAESGTSGDSGGMGGLAEKCRRFLTQLTEWRAMARVSPVYDVISYLYYQLDYYALVLSQPLGERQAANLDVLLEKAVLLEKRGLSRLDDFCSYIEELERNGVDYAQPDIVGTRGEAVTLMTIHKSKGLEFPVVFLGMADHRFNLRDGSGNMLVDNDEGLAMVCYDRESRRVCDWPYKNYIAEHIRRSSRQEEQRVLYVALTRAKEKLVVVGSLNYRVSLNKMEEAEDEVQFKKCRLRSKLREKFDRHQLNQASGYLLSQDMNTFQDWIVSSLVTEPAFEEAFEAYCGSMCQMVEGSYGGMEYLSPRGSGRGDGLSVSFLSHELLYEDYKSIIRDIRLPEESRNGAGTSEEEVRKGEELIGLLERQRAFVYPFENRENYPEKTSVSALKAREMERKKESAAGAETGMEAYAGTGMRTHMGTDIEVDMDMGMYMEQRMDMEMDAGVEADMETGLSGSEPLKTPDFMSGRQEGLSSAGAGNGFHKLMQLTPLDKPSRPSTADEVRVFVDRLENRRLLDAGQAGFLKDNADRVLAFFREEKDGYGIVDRMALAQKNGFLFREQPFMHRYLSEELFDGGEKAGEKDGDACENEPAGNTAGYRDGQVSDRRVSDGQTGDGQTGDGQTGDGGEYRHTTLLQGIIDAFFFENDHIVLLDYKTDGAVSGHIDERELLSRYRAQFYYYKKALEALTGKEVRECYIYSFTLEKWLPVNV